MEKKSANYSGKNKLIGSKLGMGSNSLGASNSDIGSSDGSGGSGGSGGISDSKLVELEGSISAYKSPKTKSKFFINMNAIHQIKRRQSELH